jgi:hypothetical protein
MAPASASIGRARPLPGAFVDIGISGTPCVDRNLAFDAAFDGAHRRMSFRNDRDVSTLNREGVAFRAA